jgi:hypothetical protein
MAKVQEIAVMWSWDDGTRCVLCGNEASDSFELQVFQNGRAVRTQPVSDVFEALSKAGPTLELDYLAAKRRLS